MKKLLKCSVSSIIQFWCRNRNFQMMIIYASDFTGYDSDLRPKRIKKLLLHYLWLQAYSIYLSICKWRGRSAYTVILVTYSWYAVLEWTNVWVCVCSVQWEERDKERESVCECLFCVGLQYEDDHRVRKRYTMREWEWVRKRKRERES